MFQRSQDRSGAFGPVKPVAGDRRIHSRLDQIGRQFQRAFEQSQRPRKTARFEVEIARAVGEACILRIFRQPVLEQGVGLRILRLCGELTGLLGNGLSEPYNTPDDATFESWVSTYGLTDPVLYDQGFAYALFPEFVEAYTGESFGYPTWLVVDPTMNLIHGNVGFGDWDSVGDIIREADAR